MKWGCFLIFFFFFFCCGLLSVIFVVSRMFLILSLLVSWSRFLDIFANSSGLFLLYLMAYAESCPLVYWAGFVILLMVIFLLIWIPYLLVLLDILFSKGLRVIPQRSFIWGFCLFQGQLTLMEHSQMQILELKKTTSYQNNPYYKKNRNVTLRNLLKKMQSLKLVQSTSIWNYKTINSKIEILWRLIPIYIYIFIYKAGFIYIYIYIYIYTRFPPGV